MKTKDNIQRSIAFLSVLAGLLYTISLISTITDGYKDGLEGTSSYWASKLKKKDFSIDESVGYKKVTLVSNEDYLFQDSILNKTNNTYIPLHYPKIDVIAVEDEGKSLLEILLFIPLMICILLFIPIMFYIPVLFYKLMISIYKGNIFTEENIERINRLGYIFLFFYGVAILLAFYSIMEERSLVSVENYRHQSIDFLKSANVLLFAVITLLIGKVMKKALIMKEEQELTI